MERPSGHEHADMSKARGPYYADIEHAKGMVIRPNVLLTIKFGFS